MSTRFDVVSVGETMIRLAPPNFERLPQATSLDIQIGGAESNVSVNLARLGLRTSWLSRLPDHALGRRVTSQLNAYDVDTSGVVYVPGERVGTYFIELSVPPRPNRVIYDRANSAASRMTVADVNFDMIASARWLHTTGIMAAISSSCLEVTREVLQFARNRGVTTSFDVNYRALLWPPEQAGAALAGLLPWCDYALAAHRDAVTLFQADEDPIAAARQLRQRFDNKVLILTIGESGAIAATADGAVVESPQRFKVPQIVDRIGAGDAFDAGFIAGQVWGLSVQDAMDYGNAMSALKITMPGDLALVTKDEVDALVGGAKGASVR
jgi:2-dehydro-3-deoxygluconokinase